MNRTDISKAQHTSLMLLKTTTHVATSDHEGATYQLTDEVYLCDADGAYWIIAEEPVDDSAIEDFYRRAVTSILDHSWGREFSISADADCCLTAKGGNVQVKTRGGGYYWAYLSEHNAHFALSDKVASLWATNITNEWAE